MIILIRPLSAKLQRYDHTDAECKSSWEFAEMSSVRTSVSAPPMDCHFSEWDPQPANRCRTTPPLTRSSLRRLRLFHGIGASISSHDTPWPLISDQILLGTCGYFSLVDFLWCWSIRVPNPIPFQRIQQLQGCCSVHNWTPLAHHAVQPAMMRVGDITPLSPPIDFETTLSSAKRVLCQGHL